MIPRPGSTGPGRNSREPLRRRCATAPAVFQRHLQPGPGGNGNGELHLPGYRNPGDPDAAGTELQAFQDPLPCQPPVAQLLSRHAEAAFVPGPGEKIPVEGLEPGNFQRVETAGVEEEAEHASCRPGETEGLEDLGRSRFRVRGVQEQAVHAVKGQFDQVAPFSERKPGSGHAVAKPGAVREPPARIVAQPRSGGRGVRASVTEHQVMETEAVEPGTGMALELSELPPQFSGLDEGVPDSVQADLAAPVPDPAEGLGKLGCRAPVHRVDRPGAAVVVSPERGEEPGRRERELRFELQQLVEPPVGIPAAEAGGD